MANSISFDSKQSKNTQSSLAKQEVKSSAGKNYASKAVADLVEQQSRPSVSRDYGLTQPNFAQAAYEEYLTTGQISPKYASSVSFDELEAFGQEHTHKLRDGRYFYSYEDTAIMDGYQFDKDAIAQAKELFDDYWEKTGSQSAKWGYDLTNPEDYQRYMDGRPSLKYEEGYGDDPYSLWLKENGLGHAEFFTNDSGSGYYDKALFDVAEVRKQEQETADFMKAVKSRARYLAEDPSAITMDEIYAATQDVQSANPEWRHFDLENPGTAKKTIEDFQDSASPDLAYQEYLDSLDKKRGEYGYIYMDELYSSVTGKPYTATIDGTLAEKSSSSSSSSSSTKTAATEEKLFRAAADKLIQKGELPTEENIDKAVSEVIASDTEGIFDGLKFVEEKDYSDSTWGSVSTSRDKAKGITISEAKDGIEKAYADIREEERRQADLSATEIVPPLGYHADNKGRGVPDDEWQKYKPSASVNTSQPSEDYDASYDTYTFFKDRGYSEKDIKYLIEEAGLYYEYARKKYEDEKKSEKARNEKIKEELWKHEREKTEKVSPVGNVRSSELLSRDESFLSGLERPEEDEPSGETVRESELLSRDEALLSAFGRLKTKQEKEALVSAYRAQMEAEEARLAAEAKALSDRQGKAETIIDEAIEATKAKTHRTRVREYSVDVAIDRLMNDMGLSFEEATALMREDGRLDYRDSTTYQAMKKEEAEKVDAIIRGNPIFADLQSAIKEEYKTSTAVPDSSVLDTKAAATKAYEKLREAGVDNVTIAQILTDNGLDIREAEGFDPNADTPTANEDLDALIESAVAAEKRAKDVAKDMEDIPIGTTTFSGVGPSSEAPIFKDVRVVKAVDSALLSLIDDQGYSPSKAFALIEADGRLDLNDSERYKDAIAEYRASGEGLSPGEIKEIVVNAKNDSFFVPASEPSRLVENYTEFLSNEVYSDIMEITGGDAEATEAYMRQYGLSSDYVSSVQKERVAAAEAAAEAEAARVKKEAEEDAKFDELFKSGDAIYDIYLRATDSQNTAYISNEEQAVLAARVEALRDFVISNGGTNFDADNALRRNGLGHIISVEESGEHFMADVLREGGLDPELADAVAASYDAETKAEYGKNARYAENWEDSTDDVVFNTVLGAFVGGTLKVVNGALGFADMVTGDRFDSLDDAIDFCNELQSKVAALAADQNHPLAAKAFEIGSEVVKMYITLKTSELLGKSFKSIGLRGKSKFVDFVVDNFSFVSGAIGSYYDEAERNGATKSDARTFAIISGGMEGVLERSIFSGKLIPSISSWVESSALNSGLKTNVKSAILRFGTPALNMALTAIGEGYEEGVSAVLSGFMRSWTWDDHYRIEGKQVAEDAIMGMAVGLIFGAFSAPSNSRRNQAVMQTYELFKAFGDSVIGTTPSTQPAPTVPIDDLAAATYVETEVPDVVWSRFKEDYESGRVAEVSDEEFTKAYAVATTLANKSKQESRRYKEKTADYESQVSNAQGAVEVVLQKLKGLQESVDKRADKKYTKEEAKTFKGLVDELIIKERDLERATAAAKTGKAAADEEYAGNAGKIKSDYADAVKTVKDWFMQRALKMDLRLFGEKANAQETEATEPVMAQTEENDGVSPEVRTMIEEKTAAYEAARTAYESIASDQSATEEALYEAESAMYKAQRDLDDTSVIAAMQMTENGNPDKTHIDTRDLSSVGKDRNMNAFSYDHPAMREFYVQVAEVLSADLAEGTKGERFYNPENGTWSGQTRMQSEVITKMLDSGMRYAQIEDGLERIIRDHGEENVANAKKVELFIDEALTNGFNSLTAGKVEANSYYVVAKQMLREGWANDTDSPASDTSKPVDPAKPIEPVQDTVEPQVVLPAGDGPVEGIISQDLAKANNWFKNWFNKIHAWTFAGQRSLERVSAKQKKDGSAVSLASAMTAYRNAGGTVEYILKDALVDRYGNDLGVGSFDSMIAEIKDPNKFIEYMSNLHNIDRMSIEANAKPQLDAAMSAVTNFLQQHPELSGVSISDAAKANQSGTTPMAEYARLASRVQELKALKNKAVMKSDDGKKAKTADESRQRVDEMEKETPELKQWAKRYNEWMNAFGHAWLVDTGIVSQETWDEWHEKYKNYFPTNRTKYEGEGKGTSYVSKSNAGILDPVKQATGATSEIADFRNIIARQINSYVRTVRKNDVLTNLYSWAEINPEAAKHDAKVIDDPSKLDVVKSGIDFTDMETDPETLAFWSIEEGRHIVRSKKDGDWVYMAVSEENFKSIEDLFSRKYSDPAEAVMKVGRALTNLKKGFITVWNPFFALRNVKKDVQTAYISDESANPAYLLSSMKTAAVEMHNNSERWRLYKSLGSRGSGYFNSRKPYLEQLTGNPKGRLSRFLSASANATSAFGEYTEDLSRFAAFIRYLDKHGDTPQNRLNAANYAAEITVDFSRSGRAGKFVDSFCIYMNAQLQGVDKVGRQFFGAESSWKTRGNVLGKTAVMGIASALFRHLFWDLEENEHYQNLPGYVKDAYFCIPNPFDLDENGTSKSFYRFPKAQNYNVFISAFDRFATMWLEDQSIEEAYDGFMDSFVSALPVSPSIAFVSNFMAVKNNEDWKGSAIEPSYMSGEAVTDKYDSGTSVISVRLSKLLHSMGIDLSPMMIDYVIDQNSGVIGDFLLPSTAVETFDKFGTEEQSYNASSAAKSVLEIIERQFVVDPLYSNGITSKFYEAKEEASAAASEAKREREAAKVSKESDEEKLAKNYGSMSYWLSASYKEERAILNSEVNSKERDKKLDRIREVRMEALKAFMEDPMNAKVEKYKDVIK